MDIIKRESEIEKETVSTRGIGERMQVSYNNYGHLVLRFFSDMDLLPDGETDECAHCGLPIFTADERWFHAKHDDRDPSVLCYVMFPPTQIDTAWTATPKSEHKIKPTETLIVLDRSESTDLIKFVKNTLAEWS